MNVIGDVQGRTCILQDDIIDTAGTIQKAAVGLMEAGAERVLACAVHGVLSGPAIERIEKSPIDQLIVTNTIPLPEAGQQCKKIVVLPVGRARAGHSEYPRRDLGLFAVCVGPRGLKPALYLRRS